MKNEKWKIEEHELALVLLPSYNPTSIVYAKLKAPNSIGEEKECNH
jgi:hypothetical protein